MTCNSSLSAFIQYPHPASAKEEEVKEEPTTLHWREGNFAYARMAFSRIHKPASKKFTLHVMSKSDETNPLFFKDFIVFHEVSRDIFYVSDRAAFNFPVNS